MSKEIKNPLFSFSTSDEINAVFAMAKTYRDGEKVFSDTAEKEKDDVRIKKSLEFLFAAGPGFSGFIAAKPEIENPRDALPYWVNHDSGNQGVELQNAVKSLAYQNKAGDIYVVVMPNHLELPKNFLKTLDLKRYDFAEDGAVIPRTINPGTMTMIDANIKFLIHHEMNNGDYRCNNLGSKFLSYSVSSEHHAAAMKNLTSEKIAVAIYDGSLEDLATKITTPTANAISAEGQQALNLAYKGDYFKY